jgi:hypothetical protein
MRRHVTIGAVVIGLALSSCGGDDGKATAEPTPSDGIETPSESTPTPSAPSGLPPEFLKCMADQGYDISSSDDIHSAPPQVLQDCFESFHQGGGAP